MSEKARRGCPFRTAPSSAISARRRPAAMTVMARHRPDGVRRSSRQAAVCSRDPRPEYREPTQPTGSSIAPRRFRQKPGAAAARESVRTGAGRRARPGRGWPGGRRRAAGGPLRAVAPGPVRRCGRGARRWSTHPLWRKGLAVLVEAQRGDAVTVERVGHLRQGVRGRVVVGCRCGRCAGTCRVPGGGHDSGRQHDRGEGENMVQRRAFSTSATVARGSSTWMTMRA